MSRLPRTASCPVRSASGGPSEPPSIASHVSGSAVTPGYPLAPMPDTPNAHSLLLILAKDLASRLATPVFVVDHEGTLLYFNESAEPVLGLSYAEVGGLPREKWATLFEPRGDDDE